MSATCSWILVRNHVNSFLAFGINRIFDWFKAYSDCFHGFKGGSNIVLFKNVRNFVCSTQYVGEVNLTHLIIYRLPIFGIFSIPKGFGHLVFIVSILSEYIHKMGFLFLKVIMNWNSHNSGCESVENTNFLRRMVVRVGMKVLFCVCFLTIYLVRYGTILVSID